DAQQRTAHRHRRHESNSAARVRAARPHAAVAASGAIAATLHAPAHLHGGRDAASQRFVATMRRPGVGTCRHGHDQRSSWNTISHSPRIATANARVRHGTSPAMYVARGATGPQKKSCAPSAVIAFALPATCATRTKAANTTRFSTRFAWARR